MSEAKGALIDYLSSRVQSHEVDNDIIGEILDNDELIFEAALRVLRYREQGDENILTHDGWTFFGGSKRVDRIGGAEKMSIEHLVLVSDIAIDNRGRVRKNKHGARGAEPVENPAPAIGKMDPLQANATLLDRLMLQHAASYRFGGIVDGVGFFVTTTIEFGSEGWAFVRHYEDPYWSATREMVLQPCILAHNETTGEQIWLPLDMAGVPGFNVVDMEEEREAIQLALDLCDGRKKPVELDPVESAEEGTSIIRVSGGYGPDGPLEQKVEAIDVVDGKGCVRCGKSAVRSCFVRVDSKETVELHYCDRCQGPPKLDGSAVFIEPED